MLKDLLRNTVTPGFAVPLLNEAALLHGKRDTLTRNRACFHPSEISKDFCPRAWLLGQKNKDLYLNKTLSLESQWRVDVGTELHVLVQRRLASSGKLFGNWVCTRYCNGKPCVYIGFKPNETCTCNTKLSPQWRYQEVDVIDKELNIRGNTDGIVVLSKGKYVFEFKTITTRTFSTLAEPLEEHREQVLWYLDILSRNSWEMEKVLLDCKKAGVDVTEQLRIVAQKYAGAVIVYMDKDTQKLKEFLITMDADVNMPAGMRIKDKVDTQVMSELDSKKALLRQTLEWQRKGELPPRLDLCTTKSCTMARKCFAVSVCFGGNDDGKR